MKNFICVKFSVIAGLFTDYLLYNFPCPNYFLAVIKSILFRIFGY